MQSVRRYLVAVPERRSIQSAARPPEPMPIAASIVRSAPAIGSLPSPNDESHQSPATVASISMSTTATSASSSDAPLAIASR